MSTLAERLRSLFSKAEPDDPFLEAAMAASAVVSMADGELDVWEEVRVEQVVERMAALQVFDPRRAGELHRGFAATLARDPARGKRKALAAVEKISGDREKARLVVGVCIAVAVADRSFSPSESAAIRELCDRLDVPPSDAEAWLQASGASGGD